MGVSALFILALFISLMIAPNFQLALYGPSGRLTGFLTYLCFAILFLAIAQSDSKLDIKSVTASLTFLGGFQTFYNLLQIAKLDPIDWNNPYGLVVGTLGNSNFTIALTAICWIASFWHLIHFGRRGTKVLIAILLILEIYVMWQSQVRQGFILIGFGLAAVFVSKLTLRSKKLGILAACCFASLGILTLLGALQKGPFAEIIFKESVTYRGDYWRAALSMFKDNPITGVGLGHFGQAFASYRDLTQVSRRGPSFVSDQAHSVPLDFLSMGGLIFASPYLILIFVVLHRALRIMKKDGLKQSQDLLILLILFGAYFLQSFISIDQIGLAIWGWVFLGLIANRTYGLRPVSNRRKRKTLQNVAQLVLAGVAITIITPQWKSNTILRDSTAIVGSDENSNYLRLQKLMELDSTLIDSHYYSEAAKFLLANRQIEGIDFAKRALEMNPNDLDALKYLVIAGKQSQNLQLIESYGSRLIALDPYTDLIE